MATIIIPNFTTQKTMVGLNTYQYTVQSAAMHQVRIVISHHQSSNLTCSIIQTGSNNATLATVTVQPIVSPADTAQSSTILTATANCAVGDTLSFVLTSSNIDDQQLNNVKSDMDIHVGFGN